MCILTCDQSLSSLKAVHLKYSFSRIWRTGGELLFLTQAVWLDFELFRLKKIDCCKRLRQENRKFASLDSYCKRKKSFVFVKKKSALWLTITILHISVSTNHGHIQQVHKAPASCIAAWLLSCLKCWQSHGSSDHTHTLQNLRRQVSTATPCSWKSTTFFFLLKNTSSYLTLHFFQHNSNTCLGFYI